MRLCTRRYKNYDGASDWSSERDACELVRAEPDYESFLQEVHRRSLSELYEEDAERAALLPGYIKLAVAFSETYEVDMNIESEVDGIVVKLFLRDSAMPEEMTRIFGRLVTCSTSLCTWTGGTAGEYDLVVELGYRTRKLKK